MDSWNLSSGECGCSSQACLARPSTVQRFEVVFHSMDVGMIWGKDLLKDRQRLFVPRKGN
ncbi:MAG: hypothetical protein MUO76_20115 [Anaerolineaceae bacterium]|nr:hypothetical protein [Anaerolineaceae bacterium]